MKYYIAKTVSGDFPAIVERAIESLKAEGFGVLTDIDVKATMKKKLDLDFRDYRILGACNPPLAHQALTADDKIGTMLPCNVIVQDLGGGQIEVAAIDRRYPWSRSEIRRSKRSRNRSPVNFSELSPRSNNCAKV
jgi:uncharacterized protein (DUF302 family)